MKTEAIQTLTTTLETHECLNISTWLIKQLDELCEVTSSKRIYANELSSSGVPFFRSKEIIEKLNGQETHSNALFISEERFQEILQARRAECIDHPADW